jgi:RHS repeat-associated protein
MGLATDLSTSLKFWFHQSGWNESLKRTFSGQEKPSLKAQEKQKDRDARVARIEIYPGDVTVQVDERVAFTAVAFDQNGDPVGGVRVKWSCQDEDRNVTARVSQRGDFVATIYGKFKVTAETESGKKAHVKVTVTEGAKRRRDDKPSRIREVSTREQSKVAASQPGKEGVEQVAAHASSFRATRRASRAHASASVAPAAPMPLPGDGWDSSNYLSADDPGNTRGNPIGSAQDDGAGSGNFQIAAPVLSLPGRGIDIGLGLAYNSRVWNKADSQITFDIDRDWPAPGWSLGFGKLVGMGVDNGSMIIDADGTRHGYAGTVVYGPNQNYTNFTGHTTDGTFIDYTHHTGLGGAMTDAQARYPNGTVIEYGAQGVGAMYPTRITDANGNYITITYVNNTGPQIQTVTDTLGRVINFHYDANNLLTAITAPALGTGTRTLVRLHYAQLSLNYSFSGLTPVVRNSTPWVIDAIYYPATSTGYWFGDTDSYSSYGMITKAIEQRGMGFSASSLNDQGTVTPGSMTQQEAYDFQYTGLTNAPTFTSMTETWTRDGVNTDQATTQYEVHENSTPRTISVTLPNGTKSTQYSYNYSSLSQTDPLKALDGLVYLDETRDSNNTLLQSSTATWEAGAYGSPRPTRVEATDERSQVTATAFSYGSVYNQVIEARNYDYGGQTLLRSTRTQYENSPSYTDRHIFNLPTIVEVYAGDNTTRVARTEYHYDDQLLTDTPGVVMHDDASNPFAPQFWIPGRCHCEYNEFGYCTEVCDEGHNASAYDAATDYRGLVTQTTTYANAGTEPASGAITESRRYDITGNLVTASTSCCQQTSISYTQATQYAYPISQTRGSSDPNSSLHVTTSATYDFNTGLGLTATDPNGRTSQTTYFADTLRPDTVYSPTGANVSYVYDEAGMSITQTTRLTDNTVADQNVRLLNGRGQIRREKALGVNNVWDMVDVQYDVFGRVTQQSLPYRSGDTIQWSTTTYDTLGRVKTSQAPDGSTTQAFYNETSRPSVASSYPGQTTRVVDAWGRERWGRTDAGNRLVEVVEPKADGDGTVATGGYLTNYSCNTLGNLTTVSQNAQTRSFSYDSLGRMTRQKLAEANATLDNNGQYVTSGGTWSDFFTYDDRSNMTSRTDARGVKVVFSYDNNGSPDPLNRLQSISFDMTGFQDTAHPVIAAPGITYAYMTTGDITRISSVTTAGVSTDSLSYDSEGRVATRTLTLANRTAYPLMTDYIYDTLDRVTDVSYPAEYGTGTAPRKVVTHNYDVASRLSGLKVGGTDYASQIAYNAASQTTSLQVGVAGANQINESYDYNQQTGLLSNQKVWRGTGSPTNPLLDLSYDYLRPNTSTGRTGQLTRIINNRDASHSKDRNYEYDALGRLVKATGGTTASPIWTENYAYDQYGNRTSVAASGNTAKLEKPLEPKAQLPTVELAMKSEIGKPDEVFSNHAMVSDSEKGIRLPAGGEVARAGTASSAMPAPQSTPVFTDDPLAPGVTPIKAVHITELRDAINQLRTRAGLSAATWTDSQLAGTIIKAAHITELRAKLDEARLALGLSNAAYTDPSLGAGSTPIKAVHITELRDRVKSAWTASTQVPRDGLANLTYNVTSNHISTTGYEYDAAGNLTRSQSPTGGWQRFEYDAAGRLVNVKADNNTLIANYTYGASNQRLITTEGNLKTYYAWGGEATIAEYTEANSSGIVQWSKSYVYLGARLLATLQPNGNGGEFTQFHHPDRLGTRLITNAQDTSVQEQASLPFGTALDAESTGSTNRRFTSYDRSASTGLDYAVNRHYDSSQGRFTQVDPIGMGAASLDNPQTLNMYAYCGNDPINHTDPNGLFWGKLFRAIGKITKVFNRIVKWALVALMIAVVVVAIVVSPEAAVQLLMGVAKFLVKIGIFKETPMIYGATEIGTKIGIGVVGKILAGIEAVGTVSSYMQQKRKKIKELKDSIYNDKALMKKINDCITKVFGLAAIWKLGVQTKANAPDVNVDLSSADLQNRYTHTSTYATGVGNEGGTYGRIYIGSEFFSSPTEWTQNPRGGAPGRSPLQNAYVHELGNLLSYRLAGGYLQYGTPEVPGARVANGGGWDPDSGWKFQLCVFGN